MKKKIAVFTSTRADYGILRPLVKAIAAHPALELTLMVTGTHLLPEHGLTVNEIEGDGVRITFKLPTMKDEGTRESVAASYAETVRAFSGAFSALRPDLFLVLGDRYEAHAAASTAIMHSIPVGHLHGGELSFGATDEFYRHSITKLSQHHFTSTEEYRKRVISMGESPDRVINAGALAYSNLQELSLPEKNELLGELALPQTKKLALVTLHPETTKGEEENLAMLEGLFEAMRSEDLFFLLTRANADYLGRKFNELYEDFATKNPSRAKLVASLGTRLYFGCMKHFNLMLGNSSSGIIESPLFGIPTVNVGVRQAGRVAASNVIHSGPTAAEQKKALTTALTLGRKAITDNPYYKENTVSLIIDYLTRVEPKFGKTFYSGKE